MILYLSIVLFVFLASMVNVNVRASYVILCLLMLFLCFGYMTGSDWRAYEYDYYNHFTHRSVEPGYMLLSDAFSYLGIDFWFFHILIKCCCFAITMFYLFHLMENYNLFFPLVMWIASFGLYMYIDCPFRNLISCTISIIAFVFLFKGKYLLYYFFVLLAMTFHLSAVMLLFVPIARFEKVKSIILVSIYFSLLLVLYIGGVNMIINMLSGVLPPIILDRILYYDDDSGFSGSVLSVGLLPRLLCLFLMIRCRSEIVESWKHGKFVFNMSYLYLLFSLVYYVIPMLFRSALFLAPFYVTIIAYSIYLLDKYSQSFLKYCWLAISLAITITTVRSVYYVPYSNIIVHLISDDMYDYEYRDNYNFQNSPYSND